ncbi:MAG: hypothetical protein IKN04_02815 [Clostridia bacterium]|nr:hypothetical protein [Clostridia bacterium]
MRIITHLTAILLCLVIIIPSGLCESWNDPALLDLSDTLGYDTHYLLYDVDYYESSSLQPGKVVKVKYTTDVYGKTMKRWVNVYLPYGYEENGAERYPVIYFFHGGGCDQNTLLGNPFTVNAFDHMIETGIARPFIFVAPTYYYDIRAKKHDVDLFEQEMRKDLMPAVEGAYRTYAETADEAGFSASRDHRAICGFSSGTFYAWGLLSRMMDVCRYYLPCCGAGISEQEMEAVIQTAKEHPQDFFLYLSCGGREDVAYPHCLEASKRLRAQTDIFHYGTDSETDNFFFSLSDNPHLDNCTKYYLYNAFYDVLFKN